MKGVGKGIKEFKKATSQEPDSDREIPEKKDWALQAYPNICIYSTNGCWINEILRLYDNNLQLI